MAKKYEQRELGGVLFQTVEKKSDKAPDWYGDILIEGKKYKLAGWTKPTQYGELISLKAELDNGKEYKQVDKLEPLNPEKEINTQPDGLPF